jgi:hypothetical protein
MFVGGPLDGQGVPPDAGGGMEAPADDLSEGDRFKRLLSDIRALLASNELSEQNTLQLSKAETLIQTIKASEEKEQDAAMNGKLSPGILRKVGGGGSSY